MSASERLKALKEDYEGPYFDPLRNALPQIVALTEAVENARLKLRHRDIVGTETWNAMESALDALDQVLGGSDVT